MTVRKSKLVRPRGTTLAGFRPPLEPFAMGAEWHYGRDEYQLREIANGLLVKIGSYERGGNASTSGHKTV